MSAGEGYIGFRDNAFANIVGNYSKELRNKIHFDELKVLISGYKKAKAHMGKM